MSTRRLAFLVACAVCFALPAAFRAEPAFGLKDWVNHDGVSKCGACHHQGSYQHCDGCHQDNLPNRPCLICHSGRDSQRLCWKCHIGGSNHVAALGSSNPHGTVPDCKLCHLRPHTGSELKPCHDCHFDTHRFHASGAGLGPPSCSDCHNGRLGPRFHNPSHGRAPCRGCHTSASHPSMPPLPGSCLKCHRAAKFGTRSCTACHSGAYSLLRHSRQIHARTPHVPNCRSCHKDKARGRSGNCTTCHTDVAAAHHTSASPSLACSRCHQDKHNHARVVGCPGCHVVSHHGGRRSVRFCTSCHGFSTHAGRVACTRCHGNIHGRPTIPTSSVCLSCHRPNHAPPDGACLPCHSRAIHSSRPAVPRATPHRSIFDLPLSGFAPLPWLAAFSSLNLAFLWLSRLTARRRTKDSGFLPPEEDQADGSASRPRETTRRPTSASRDEADGPHATEV